MITIKKEGVYIYGEKTTNAEKIGYALLDLADNLTNELSSVVLNEDGATETGNTTLE